MQDQTDDNEKYSPDYRVVSLNVMIVKNKLKVFFAETFLVLRWGSRV